MDKLDALIAYLAPDTDFDDSLPKADIFRALMNIRPAQPVSDEFLALQDNYLQERLAHQVLTSIEDLTPVENGIYLWQGDITTLAVDAIVNAANSQMLGCFAPLHACIDNTIHSQAGVQLRLACQELMEAQGSLEPTGQAKITPGFNLPARHVLHTVGPIIQGQPSHAQMKELASCYQSCLDLAVENGLTSIAFCCISTGEFHFPNNLAAKIAVATVRNYLADHPNLQVIFNVFKDEDLVIYQKLLS